MSNSPLALSPPASDPLSRVRVEPPRRFVALDRLRALAVLLMIQGHAFHALLDPAAQTGPWFRLHKLVHGLTAPMFLMGAGLAFGITTYPRFRVFHAGGAEHTARLRRYGLIVLLGYALQLPGHSLGALLSDSPAVWREILKVGPLQLIGLTLFMAQLATRVTSDPRRHALGALALALAVALVAPFAWNVTPQQLPGTALLALLNGKLGSQFPAFPWAAFVLGALALSAACISERGARLLRSGLVWAGAGALACGVSYALYRQGVNPYGEHDFWRSSPLHTLFRAGGVALFLGAATLGSHRQGRIDRALAVLARHSLLAYVAHLLFLYGSFPAPGFVHVFGRGALSIQHASLASVALIALTVAVIVTRRHLPFTAMIPHLRQSLTRLSSRCDMRLLASRVWTKSEPYDTERARVPGSASPSPRSS